jgi:beta-lactam-binding protein with PASTA domain
MSDEHTPDLPEEESAEPTPGAGDSAQVPPLVPEEDWFRSVEPVATPASEQTAPAPEPASGPEPSTVPAGSRVILIVSRGPSPAPPAVPVGMLDIVGEQQGAALLKLQALGLSAQVLHDHNDRLPRGYVVGQHPMAGAGVLPASEAVIVVSSGKAQIPTPDVMLPRVVGLHQTLASETLVAASLVPRVLYDYDPVAPVGLVLSQIPSDESLSVPLRKRGSKLWLVAVAVLVVIALAAGVIWYLNRPTSIPNLVGLSQVQAEQSVELAGFQLGSVATSQTANEKEIGNVVAQAPSPGGVAAHGSSINLVVAGGQLLAPVPNVVGMQQAEGIKSLQDNGLLFEVTRSYSSTVPSGSVISQAPLAGQKVPPRTTIGLSVSIGVQTITVPSVVGQLKTTAEAALRSSGPGVATASNYDSTTPAGQVMGQQPTVGTGVVPGAVVGLTVSKGVPALGSAVATIPVVVGKSDSKARSALKSRQLKYLVVSRTGTGQGKNKVVAQLPDAGAFVPRKSVVILFVSDGK